MKPMSKVLLVLALAGVVGATIPAAAIPFSVGVAGPTAVYLNEPTVYSGTLASEPGGVGIPLQQVSVRVDGVQKATATTDLNGGYSVILIFTEPGTKQVRAHAFSAVSAIQTVSAPLTVTVSLNPNVDYDSDGITQAGGDCAPLDAAVYPGAPDKPDSPNGPFLDSNCDGIDGDIAKAIFVSTSGNDANAGTMTMPKKTWAAGISAAAASGKDVYIAQGTYAGAGAALATNVGLYGGYSASSWAIRGPSIESRLVGIGTGLVADGDTGVVLQLLRVESGSPGSAVVGATMIGLKAINGSSVVLDDVFIIANPANDGAAGPNGAFGPNGGPGALGQPGSGQGFFCGGNSQPQGGPGGIQPANPMANGGMGGRAASGSNSGFTGFNAALGTPGGTGTPAGAGNWSPPAPHWGRIGADGASGPHGIGGAPGWSALGWAPAPATSGISGSPGAGGGGGGGGGGGSSGGCSRWGGGGGGGGAGGAGGLGGRDGTPGGASVGIFAWASSITIKNSDIRTNGGGDGGAGGAGGAGGLGGLGGRAVNNAGNVYGGGSQADGSNGGKGGDGGRGGLGGFGGGGAGGSSIGIVAGGGSPLSQTGVSFIIGAGGIGGSGPSSGQAGQSQNVLTI